MTSESHRRHLLWHHNTEIPSWHNFDRFTNRHSGAGRELLAGIATPKTSNFIIAK
tara:strand:+ start:5052 stop:5216 length:165 start_codon:yes stop_codon:yes gene_type:complete